MENVGTLAAVTGFSPMDILAMTPGDIRFWMTCLGRHFDRVRREQGG